MKTFLFIFTFIFLITSITSMNYGKHIFESDFVPYSPQVYTVDLDQPPIEQWRQIITDKNESIWTVKDVLIEAANMNVLDQDLISLVPEVVGELYNVQFAQEIEAISQLTGMSFGLTLLINFLNEFFTYCTSIVAQNSDGLIIHGRNLDFNFPNYLANLTVTVEFYKNGSYLYTGNVMAGYLGILTGMKPGAFGVTVNDRTINDTIYNNLWEILEYRAIPSSYLVKLVMEEENDYESAIQRLSTTPIIAPIYYTVSGVKSGQGIVITRNRNDVHDYYSLNLTAGIWFFVQTNYDRDVPDPSNDYRRIPAEHKMEAIGQQNISYDTMFYDVLAQEPNLNNFTIYTTIMSENTSYFNTTIWYQHMNFRNEIINLKKKNCKRLFKKLCQAI